MNNVVSVSDEERKARQRAYYQANRERFLAASKKYARVSKDKNAAAVRKYKKSAKYLKTLRTRLARPEVKIKLAAASAKWYASKKGRAKSLWHAALTRAKKYNLVFELEESWILEKLTAGVCEATGLPFTFDTSPGRKQKNCPFSPSVDRINPAVGYTRENSRVVLWAFNAALADWGEPVYAQVAKAYLSRSTGP